MAAIVEIAEAIATRGGKNGAEFDKSKQAWQGYGKLSQDRNAEGNGTSDTAGAGLQNHKIEADASGRDFAGGMCQLQGNLL